ncbi:MAG: cobalamin-dependent protein, partial [Desulfatitalea sp.]|nr:cobalamin-dependent protein [Desulfatitalea sp.]
MKIFLVQVPTSHLGAGERVYPLGLARLSALIGAEHETSGLDMNLNADPWPELKSGLEALQPDLVVFSFRNIDPLAGHQTSYLSSLRTAAKMARALVPHAVLVVGGPAFNIFPARLMHEIPEIDYGLKGEGERAFPAMLSAFSNISRVPGVLFRKEGTVEANPGGPPVLADEIAEMDTQLFRPSDYLAGNRYVACMGIEGKRGCDLKCAYCVYPSISGSRSRLRDPVRIVDEMENLNKTYG